MANPIPKRLVGVLAKVEATYGTDAVPAPGTDGVRLGSFLNVIRPSYAWENLRADAVTGTVFPATAAVPAGSMATLDFAWEVKGPGTAYAASNLPEADPLIQACGWNQVLDTTLGLEKVTYSLLSTGHKSCTVYGYADGLLYKIVGCRGTMTWRAEAGQIGLMRFQMQGLWSSVAAAVVPSITSYDATSPVASVGMGFTVGAYSPQWSVGEFAQGAEVQRFDSGNATDGIAQFDWLDMTPGNPSLTTTVYAPDDGTGKWDTASFNPFADATARTSRTLAWTHGPAQYNRAKLSAASSYVSVPTMGETNRAASADLRYTITDTGMTIVFD